MSSNFLEDIQAHDQAWAPVLDAISAGDIQAMMAAAIDPATGCVRMALIENAWFGAPDGSDEDDAQEEPWMKGHYLDAETRREIGERTGILIYCLKAQRPELARALVALPLPPNWFREGDTGWLRVLGSFLRNNGDVTKEQLGYLFAHEDEHDAMPFLELLLEVDPYDTGLKLVAETGGAPQARVNEAAMNLRIRQAAAQGPQEAPTAPAPNRARRL